MAVSTFSTTPGEERAHITIWGCDGTRIVTPADTFAAGASFSPDGHLLAWLESEHPDDERGWLVVADAEGGDQRRLPAQGRMPLVQLVWSPDSTTVAYEHNEILRLLNVDTGAIRVIDRRNARGPAWRPDGALTWRDSEFGIAVLEPGAARPEPLFPDSDTEPFALDWSPDGAHLAYAEHVGESTGIVVVDADGGNKRELTDPGVVDTDGVPEWSPDGTELAFVRAVGHRGEMPVLRLMTVPADGSADATFVDGAPETFFGFGEEDLFDWRPGDGC
jgi:Tol biopolymer transport system component